MSQDWMSINLPPKHFCSGASGFRSHSNGRISLSVSLCLAVFGLPSYEEKLGFSSAIAKTNPGAMFGATRQSSPDDFMLRECMVFDAHRSG